MIDLIPEFTACGKFWNCKQAYIVGDINVETRDFLPIYQFTNFFKISRASVTWINVRKPTYSRHEMLTF